MKCVLCTLPILMVAAILPLAAQDHRSTPRLTAPITRWDEAIPIGNGLLGGLLWGEGRTLRLSLDRGDLWDERLPAIFADPEWNWQAMQRLVAAGNMTRFHQLFDEPYDRIPYPTKLPGGRLVNERSTYFPAKSAPDVPSKVSVLAVSIRCHRAQTGSVTRGSRPRYSVLPRLVATHFAPACAFRGLIQSIRFSASRSGAVTSSASTAMRSRTG